MTTPSPAIPRGRPSTSSSFSPASSPRYQSLGGMACITSAPILPEHELRLKAQGLKLEANSAENDKPPSSDEPNLSSKRRAALRS